MSATLIPPGARAPSPLRDFPPRRSRRPSAGIPADVSTLDTGRRGETLEVRCVIDGCGDTVTMLRPGDHLICRGRTSQWIIVELPGRGEYAVHRDDARFVRVERSAVARGPSPARR
jgi:hypothetical protein